jgi:Flp pilus assembly protein TadD
VDARNHLGLALLRTGRPAEAAEEVLPAVRLAPNQPMPHAVLGAALAELGRLDDAVAHFRRAVALQPDLAVARLGLARAYSALGRTELAREQYETLRRSTTGRTE